MKQPTKRQVRIPAASQPEITLLLSSDNPDALRQVIKWSLPQLHDIAVHHFRDEPPGRTLQPTALVNEVCVRFLKSPQSFENRRHFFAAASKGMRRILVEAARRRKAKMRGGHLQRVDFSYAEQLGFEDPRELVEVDTALDRLQSLHPAWAEVVDLRIFGGLSALEASTVLAIGESTARKHFARALEWLRGELKQFHQNARNKHTESR
jgi:RNA polymerase sigma factor (TIGR02999 family)